MLNTGCVGAENPHVFDVTGITQISSMIEMEYILSVQQDLLWQQRIIKFL